MDTEQVEVPGWRMGKSKANRKLDGILGRVPGLPSHRQIRSPVFLSGKRRRSTARNDQGKVVRRVVGKIHELRKLERGQSAKQQGNHKSKAKAVPRVPIRDHVHFPYTTNAPLTQHPGLIPIDS
jgi:hypothetical protein